MLLCVFALVRHRMNGHKMYIYKRLNEKISFIVISTRKEICTILYLIHCSHFSKIIVHNSIVHNRIIHNRIIIIHNVYTSV